MAPGGTDGYLDSSFIRADAWLAIRERPSGRVVAARMLAGTARDRRQLCASEDVGVRTGQMAVGTPRTRPAAASEYAAASRGVTALLATGGLAGGSRMATGILNTRQGRRDPKVDRRDRSTRRSGQSTHYHEATHDIRSSEEYIGAPIRG